MKIHLKLFIIASVHLLVAIVAKTFGLEITAFTLQSLAIMWYVMSLSTQINAD